MIRYSYLILLAGLALVIGCSSTVSPPPLEESYWHEQALLAAIDRVGYQTSMTNSTKGDASTSLPIPSPSNVAAGDFLLAQITFETGSDVTAIGFKASQGSAEWMDFPGWTLVLRTNRSSDIGQAVFYRVATADDTTVTDYTFTLSKPVKAAGGIIHYKGVDTASPIVASSGNSGDSSTLAATSISAELGSMLVAFFGIKKKDTTLSVPSGMSGIYNYQNPQDVTIRAAQETSSAAGATGNRVSTASPSGDKWVAHLVALRMAEEIPTPIPVTITPMSGQAKKYDDPDPILNFSNDAGLEMSAFDGALARDPGENVGTYTILLGDLDAGPNYTLTLAEPAITFEITPGAITVTADATSKEYGEDDPALTYQVTSGSLLGSDQLSGALTRVAGDDVGTYAIQQGTLTAGSNYALTFVGANLTITSTWSAAGYGFYQPIGIPNSVFVAAPGLAPAPTSTTPWISAKGGSTIPLKFNVFVSGVEHTATSQINFSATPFTCPGGSSQAEEIEFTTTGATNLRYDTTDRQFVQNWATPRVTADSCYRATASFGDGSTLSTFVRLRR
jgi:hypothetical protein